MTAIADLLVGTVAARPRPRPKGVGRPLVTPLTGLDSTGGILGGESSAGLTPASTWAVVVQVRDRDGRIGVGTAGFGHPATATVVHELRGMVVNREPTDVAHLWETMYRATLNVGRRGVVLQAISAIDIAIWDLLGQQLDQPLYNLLGGRVRESLPAYASWLYATEDLDALAAEAAGWVEQGFRAVKQRLGYGPADGVRGIRKNVELVRTVVDAVGPEIDVMADAYMGWDAVYATRCIRAIEDAGLRLRWLEEPLIPDDIPGMARLRRSVDTPIAAGEHEATRYGFRDLVMAEAVDILQPDVNRLGGITEARRVWALGETFGLEVIPHVGAAHNFHLSISSPASPWSEFLPPPRGDDVDEDQLFWQLFPDELRPVRGVLTPTDKPGLGITLDTSLLDREDGS